MSDVRFVAAHEAGHIIVAASYGYNVGSASVDPAERFTDIEPIAIPMHAATVAAAGWVGEAMMTDRNCEGRSWYEQVPEEQRRPADDYTQLSDSVDIMMQAGKFSSRATAVDTAFEEAERIIALLEAAIKELVDLLVLRITLPAAEIHAVLHRHGLYS
jgi:hypothetical protein